MAHMEPEARKVDIIKAALIESRQSHYLHVTRVQIAKRAKVSEALVSKYFGTMKQIRRDIMRHAVKEADLTIIAQGLSVRDPVVMKADKDLRAKAATQLTGV